MFGACRPLLAADVEFLYIDIVLRNVRLDLAEYPAPTCKRSWACEQLMFAATESSQCMR